jgi:Leucine-rich repeat (LRR) protein
MFHTFNIININLIKFQLIRFCLNRKLSLSTNTIEKITGISSLKNLRILSVGRNYIKNFTGLVTILFCCCC